MKRDFKSASCSDKPGHTRGKLASHFCMLPKVKSADSCPGFSPVFLNVYDLTPVNGYMYWAGLGIYHTGIEVHGAEYAYGAHDYPTSGVFEVEPRQCPGFKFRKAIYMGTTSLNPTQVREFMEEQSTNYFGDSYNLIVKNCNHFSDDICYRLTRKRVPKWVNRLARIGSKCNCVLPDSLKVSTVPEPHIEVYESEKKHIQPFSCFSSFSMPQKEDTMYSLCLLSHYSGCLPPWESKRTRAGFFKEED